MLTDRIDQELLDMGKRLNVVSNYTVGYNNIDVTEATKHGVIVTNTPDVLTDTTARARQYCIRILRQIDYNSPFLCLLLSTSSI
jgi:lactate dehydrogenase-like 2-hydroxyacid dehydrogenase